MFLQNLEKGENAKKYNKDDHLQLSIIYILCIIKSGIVTVSKTIL